MNIYEVWTHVRGEEAIEAAEFAVTGDEGILFYDSAGRRIAAFSSGSWVSVRKLEKES